MATQEDSAFSAGAVESARTVWREGVLIALLALTINLVGNGRVGLWDRDEPRYAQCTREMLARGDYLHPMFNAEPRYHKPVLVYWLMMATTKLAGDTPYGARLVSAIAGMGTCLLVWRLGRDMLGPAGGRMAALMLAVTPIFAIESKLATTDSTLTFFLVACFGAIWRLHHRECRWTAMGFWVAFALAFLTKGPVAPAILITAGIASWWWGGPTAAYRRLDWARGLSVFGVIALPWYIAIGIISKGEFFRVSLGTQVVHRISTGMETHGGFPGYYIALSLAVFYPWSALLPVSVLDTWRKRREDPRNAFLLGWVVGPLVMLEIVRTKIIHYYLPAYPGCALMVAATVLAVARSELNLRRWALGRPSLGLLVGIGIGSTVLLLAAAMVLPWQLRLPCLVMACVLGPATLYALERFQKGATERATYSLIAAWSVLLVMAGAWLAPAIDPHRLTPMVAAKLKEVTQRTKARPLLAGYKPPGVVYGVGRPMGYLGKRDELVEVLRDGPVVSALSGPEIKALRSDPRLALELCDTVRGFDVERFRQWQLQLVVIRPAGGSAVAAGGGEKTLVK